MTHLQILLNAAILLGNVLLTYYYYYCYHRYHIITLLFIFTYTCGTLFHIEKYLIFVIIIIVMISIIIIDDHTILLIFLLLLLMTLLSLSIIIFATDSHPRRLHYPYYNGVTDRIKRSTVEIEIIEQLNQWFQLSISTLE